MKRALILFFISCIWVLNIKAQIPPGYYNGTEGLYGEGLKAVLHNIIDDHDEPSYDDLRDYILPESDEDPQNSNNIILLYTGRSQAKSTFGGGPDDWNREHVWAKSHGDFGNDPPCGTDAHMIRPTDASVNSDRGNKDFDEGGQQHSEATGCYYTAYTWEPRDAVKGDVARIILYMDVRYEGDNGELDLTAVDAVNTSPAPEHGRLSTLLDWHEQDPPDAFEINRNNVVYSYQDNRNPFIDHPEFVYDIWGESAGMKETGTWLEAGFYPNPVVNTLHVSMNTSCTGVQAIIYNSIGNQVVSDIIGSGSATIDCNKLPAGLYILSLFDEQSRKSYVSSFMKMD
ncbi:MAG: endonuclease [Bacteroidales bacterium]|nr:endonuclease [Bacteroidales bacterium]